VIYMATEPYKRLADEFSSRRVIVTPISEAAMTGMCLGAAASGYRPILSWSNVAFSFVAFDQVVNQIGRARFMSGGQQSFPIVLMGHYLNGTRSAAQHCQTSYAYFAHSGGLKVAVPSNADDARSLMVAAVRDPDPVVYLWSQVREKIEGPVHPLPDVPVLGSAKRVRGGDDLTIIAIGGMVDESVRAAAVLAETHGIEADVLDVRSIVPLDEERIMESVRRTGRVVIVDESFPACSVASDIAARLAGDAECFSALRAPIERACTLAVPIPFSAPLEDAVLPDAEDVVRHALRTIAGGAAADHKGLMR
jgi:pyruvate/2-oxoglutarate/acetoin dehydrogenase E1 component